MNIIIIWYNQPHVDMCQLTIVLRQKHSSGRSRNTKRIQNVQYTIEMFIDLHRNVTDEGGNIVRWPGKWNNAKTPKRTRATSNRAPRILLVDNLERI